MFGTLLGAIAGPVIGGLLGGSKGATNQTKSNVKSMDPRIEALYFGSDGSGGLLGDLNKWYGENKSGINPDMQAGLNHMKSVYQSPLATQGYERMGNAGYDLMGRGVAGNPFVTGQMPQFGNWGARQREQAQLNQPQVQPVAPVAQQNLGLSLSDNWAAPPAPVVAPAAPAAPAQPSMTQDEFQRLYKAEMERQRQAYINDPANIQTHSF